MIRLITPLLFPVIIFTAACLLLLQAPNASALQLEMLTLTPYLLTLAGVLLSIHFRRGRILLLLLLSIISYHLFRTHLAAGPDTPLALLTFRAASVLLPLNLLLLVLMREKGVTGSAARIRLLFFGIQLFILWLTLRNVSQTLWMTLTNPLVHWPLLEQLTIPQTSLLLLLVAAGISIIRSLRRHSPIEGGLFGAAFCFLALLNWPYTPHLPALLFSASTLIMLLAVVQESHNMAFRDDLTGLPSRRALNEQLTTLGSRYAIAMVDVDHFKRFNDTYGHDVGDQVLKMVAGRMMNVSGGGSSFRYGGEEFTVLFPGRSAKDALPHLETLRENIAAYTMSLRGEDRPKDNSSGKDKRSGARSGRDVSVTVSIGVAEAGKNLATPAEVIKAADQALYKAKQGGRNQVCLAGRR